MIVRAARDFSYAGISLLFAEPAFGNGQMVVKPIQMELVDVGPMDIIQPTLRLDHVASQSLMDELWAAGMRPTEARYPTDHVNALRDHLADMRKIVFDGITRTEAR